MNDCFHVTTGLLSRFPWCSGDKLIRVIGKTTSSLLHRYQYYGQDAASVVVEVMVALLLAGVSLVLLSVSFTATVGLGRPGRASGYRRTVSPNHHPGPKVPCRGCQYPASLGQRRRGPLQSR